MPPTSLTLVGCGYAAILAIAARRRRNRPSTLKQTLIEARHRDFCAAQSVSYSNGDPLVIVEGRGATLIDDEGREFLDTRNNVPHVGHAHPHVAAAVAKQVAKLNTNTRYLHPNVCQLARRLLDTMPSPLRDGAILFVNSGSEANDLAVRLARAATGRTRTLIVERAYHGHTIATTALSPYKFRHASFGGAGQPHRIA
jgi:4-aminobutyrate aminotransferase-like enzyme